MDGTTKMTIETTGGGKDSTMCMTLDGSEQQVDVMGSVESTRASWDGEALVLTVVSKKLQMRRYLRGENMCVEIQPSGGNACVRVFSRQ